MAKNIGKQDNAFGLAAVALGDAKTHRLAVAIALPMSLEITTTGDLVNTSGGAARLPVSSRVGRYSGEVKLTVNGVSPELSAVLLGDAPAVAAASEAAGAIEAAVDSAGAGIHPSDEITVAATAAATGALANGVLSITATSASNARVTFTGENGVVDKVDIDTAAAGDTQLQAAGLTLTVGAGGGAMVEDSVSEWQVRKGNGGIYTVRAGIYSASREYRLVGHSARGGADDPVRQVIIPRVVFNGQPMKLTDNATDGDGVELNGQMLAPADSTSDNPFGVEEKTIVAV